MLLGLIRRDHANISRLLLLLEQKLTRLEQEEGSVNYRLMLDVIDYLQNYADRYHHPLEDCIYQYYIEHRGQAAGTINQLEQEHQLLRDKTTELREIVDMILLDAIVPQDAFIGHLREFIDLQSRHLNYEEAAILPLLERELTEQDWQAIEKNCHISRRDDPLFGQEVAQPYRALAERIRQMQDE